MSGKGSAPAVPVVAFRELLLAIHDKHSEYYRNLSDHRAIPIVKHLQEGGYQPFTRDELNRALNGSELTLDLPTNKRFVFLEPVTKGDLMVPVIGFKCNSATSELRVRVGLFLAVENEDNLSIKEIGFRFELSEGAKSRHGFSHVQMMTEFDRTFGWTLRCPKWLPMDQPSFPLEAPNGVALLASVLVSLYGMHELPRAYAQTKKDHFETHFRAMSWWRTGSDAENGSAERAAS